MTSALKLKVLIGKCEDRLQTIRGALRNEPPNAERLRGLVVELEAKRAAAVAELAAIPPKPAPAPQADALEPERLPEAAMEPITQPVAVARPRVAVLRALVERTPRELAGQLAQSLEVLRRRLTAAERETLELIAARIGAELTIKLATGLERMTSCDVANMDSAEAVTSTEGIEGELP